MFGIPYKNRTRRKGLPDSWGYRIHDGAAQFRFELEGALSSADVPELEQCWHTAASTLGGKAFVVDLTLLTAIDESGRELLNRWREVGAQLVAGPEAVVPPGILPSNPEVRAARGPLASLQTALPWLIALLALLFAASLQAAGNAIVPVPENQSGQAASEILARYLAGLEVSRPWEEETVEIEASLPKLKEHGRLRAIRRLLPLGRPEYKVVESDGSRTVKQQVIARYLSAEITAAKMPPSTVAITPANYRFTFVASVEIDGRLSSIFEITPRKKREGLIQGMLWIDDGTGVAVRQSGHLVKGPSIFIKRVDVTRQTSLRDGVAEARVTHVALQTRLAGRAELVIQERPCVGCADPWVRGSN